MKAIIVNLIILGGGALGGYALRHVLGERRWTWVRRRALALFDAGEASSPSEAVATALLQSELQRLAVEAQRVADAFKPLQTPLPFPVDGHDRDRP